MDYADQLFLHTVDDLKSRLTAGDPYDVLSASALLRKLLLDGDPLVHQVNRTRRTKLRFLVVDVKPPVLSDGTMPSVWIAGDGLDPATDLFRRKGREVTLDRFFGTQVVVSFGRAQTVRDVVLFVANVMGGVHAGAPRTEKEKALTAVTNQLFLGGLSAATSQIGSIGRVALQGMEPLYSAIVDQ
jgi:hypothetical protein